MMERVEVLPLLIITLASSCLIMTSEGNVAVSKAHHRCSFEERDALLGFKQSLIDPHLILSTWEIGEDCCTWKGVSCSDTTNYVIKLDLRDEGSLHATSLVPSLFLLQHLQYLCLSSIFFNYASIPESIGSLIELTYLDLSYSGFAGVIPPHMGNLTNLRLLDLSGNYLVAYNLTWISHLSSLYFIDMSYTNLTFAINWLHEIKVLPSLSTLFLSSCNLQALPNSLPYSNFASTINTFDLSFNYISGSLPNWLGQFKSLKRLYLQSNNFNGPISFSFLNSLCDLNVLYLNENNFLELIDDGSVSKCKEYNMTDMDISYNQLSGSIPEWVGKMRRLRVLNLGENQLNGSIPQSLGQLINLVSLDLHSNRLHGSLSDINFANLSQLNSLYLSDNHLDFNMISFNWIPPFQLSFLSIRSCLVGPQFPIWLRNQKYLSHLDLSSCGISDTIPTWFWNISSQINYLNISQNGIRGKLPTSLNIALAATIDLKSNQLEGNLPQLLNFVRLASFSNNKFSSGIELYLNANTSFLAVLDLSQNHLSDEIPDSICQMPSIILLDLSHNNLLGEIPKCHGNISIYMTLKFISLSYNNLWGSIPQWMGNLSILLSLHLNNNAFQGEIPFLKNCSKLITIDLGQNYLTGNIPSWIGDRLLSLKILRLRSNKFFGSIPSELSKLKGLQILDIADNFLSGPIPRSFRLLKSMTIQNKRLEPLNPDGRVIISNRGKVSFVIGDIIDYLGTSWPDALLINIKGIDREFTDILSLVNIIDLSCNNLTGEVPIELMSLIGLISLKLSRNEFKGHIPINIGDMQSLESLDLSMNHLSGEMPESIVKLSKLNYLNLSYNQLSGRIPEGTQLDTFKESSYYGNSELCGMPLLKTCKDDEHNIHNGGSNSDDNEDDNFGLFLGMGLGFAVGLWSVLGTLLLKKSWAIAYFQWFDNITNIVYVYVAVKINRWFNH